MLVLYKNYMDFLFVVLCQAQDLLSDVLLETI